MTDGHGVSLLDSSTDLDRRILAEVEAGRGVSQRSLAQSAGVALGLANLLVRRLVRRGMIEIVKIQPNRVRYVITAAGVAEKARMTRAYLDYSIRFYAEARERLKHSFASLSAEWPAQVEPSDKTIVFYGAGEVAEIGFVCLQETDLRLVAVVDDQRQRPFFGIPVKRTSEVDCEAVGGLPYGRIVVMSLRDADKARAALEQQGCAPDRIYTL